jgi:hypothetical protein
MIIHTWNAVVPASDRTVKFYMKNQTLPDLFLFYLNKPSWLGFIKRLQTGPFHSSSIKIIFKKGLLLTAKLPMTTPSWISPREGWAKNHPSYPRLSSYENTIFTQSIG